MKKNHFFSIVSLFFTMYSYGAASSGDAHSPRIIAVGGQNTLGSEADYVSALFRISQKDVTRAPLPQGWYKDGMDLGQDICMDGIKTVFPESGDVVFHATSQGTASTLNFVSSLSEIDQSRIKLIVLDAILGSGNSAIMHNAKLIAGELMDTPGCYYSAPYAATSIFPRYSPSGKQPIKSIENITQDIPIVIVHSKGDRCLSFRDACALYYGLRSQGHRNVYFIPCEGSDHVRILARRSEEQLLLRKIIAQYNVFAHLKEGELTDADKVTVQPEIDQYRAAYEQLRSRERKHTYIPWAVGGIAVAYGTYRVAKPLVAQFCADRGIDSVNVLFSWFTKK